MSYATTTDLANALGRPVDNDDPYALAALDTATALVEAYIGRDLEQVADDEVTLDGTGTKVLVLPGYPVSALTEIVEGEDTLVADDDYQWSADGYVRRIGKSWTTDLRAVTVTYTHGYATIPDAVRLVTAQVAARLLDTPAAVKQEAIGGYSVTYTGGPALQATDLTVLERYRSR